MIRLYFVLIFIFTLLHVDASTDLNIKKTNDNLKSFTKTYSSSNTKMANNEKSI